MIIKYRKFQLACFKNALDAVGAYSACEVNLAN